MSDDLDSMFTEEDLTAIAAWEEDAYRFSVEVPTSKITHAQLDELFEVIGTVVDEWAARIEPRDWDPFMWGVGPMHRKPEPE